MHVVIDSGLLDELSAGALDRMGVVEAHEPVPRPIVQRQGIGQPVGAHARYVGTPDDESHRVSLLINDQDLTVKVEQRVERPVAAWHDEIVSLGDKFN